MKYTLEQVEAKYHQNVILQKFDSLTEYHDYLAERWLKWNSEGSNSLNDIKPLISDYRRNEKAINDLLERMKEDDIFASGLPMPENHYYGSRPNIGAYLSGSPKAMYRRDAGDQSSLNTPINIFVNINLSGTLTGQTLLIKGIAIAALAISLNATRPVSVYSVKPLTSSAWVNRTAVVTLVKLNDGIIDVGRLDYTMTRSHFHRDIAWTASGYAAYEAGKERLYSPGAWPFNGNIDTDEYNDCVKACVGCTNNDIFIPGSAIYNAALIADPIKWVKEQIAKHKVLIDEDNEDNEA